MLSWPFQLRDRISQPFKVQMEDVKVLLIIKIFSRISDRQPCWECFPLKELAETK